ncbi:MAG: hypothetical protein ACLQVN_25185 [Bryobacteraceae bacterium]
MKIWHKAVIAVIAAGSSLTAAPLAAWRAWQFHTMDLPYVLAGLKLAPTYDINTVVFSHEMIGYASELFDGTGRGPRLTRLTAAAHAEKLKVWIWVRELENVPPQFMAGGMVQMDRPGFWEWVAGRYDRLFTAYPSFDGLMLTFEESPYQIFNPARVASSLPMPDRLARLVDTIDAVCRRFGKEFIVRSFFYEPEQVDWFKEGYARTNLHVMVQTKCEPHDWDPFYPNDALIGAFPGRRQIVEFDGSSEYTGKNRIPYTQPEYFERRWRYDLARPGVAGYNIRVDHGGYDALHTPNEINIYAMWRFTQDPHVTAADVWKEWTAKRYGQAAAPEIELALRPTFDIVNLSFFALRFWITNHSRLPTFAYADEHLHSRTMAKWYPREPRYKDLEERLARPDPELLERIVAEKDAAIALAEGALRHLQNAKTNITPEQYNDLYWRLSLAERTAIVWKLHAEALFGFKVLAAGHRVPGLAERVERALTALKAEADLSAADPRIGQAPPASAAEIREFVADLDVRLSKVVAPETQPSVGQPGLPGARR